MSLHEAIFKVQCEVSKVHKDGRNPHTNSRYPTLEATLDVLNEALAKHQIVVIQQPQKTDYGWALTTIVSTPPDKEELRVETPLLGLDDGKNKMQALGSAITYARRYALLAIFKLAPTDEDDDGNALRQAVEPNITVRKGNQPEVKPPPKNYAPVQVKTEEPKGKDLSEYVITVGNKYVGKKLSEVDREQLESFSTWAAREKAGLPKYQEFVAKARAFLES